MDLWDMALRVVVALALGVAVGWEREQKKKPAGLRVHTMVTLGACTFALAALQLDAREGGVDFSRIIQGLIGGIGFLGAGAIIQSRGNVRGITTASSIWIAGALGLCAGFAYWQLALVCTLGALFVLHVIGPYRQEIVGEEAGHGDD